MSPVRYSAELTGRMMSCVPSPQSAVPDAPTLTTLRTQMLVGMLAGLMIGSGPPKRHPGAEHVRLFPVWADVVGPMVAVWTAQLVNATTDWPRSGVISGSGYPFSPPPV